MYKGSVFTKTNFLFKTSAADIRTVNTFISLKYTPQHIQLLILKFHPWMYHRVQRTFSLSEGSTAHLSTAQQAGDCEIDGCVESPWLSSFHSVFELISQRADRCRTICTLKLSWCPLLTHFVQLLLRETTTYDAISYSSGSLSQQTYLGFCYPAKLIYYYIEFKWSTAIKVLILHIGPD